MISRPYVGYCNLDQLHFPDEGVSEAYKFHCGRRRKPSCHVAYSLRFSASSSACLFCTLDEMQDHGPVGEVRSAKVYKHYSKRLTPIVRLMTI